MDGKGLLSDGKLILPPEELMERYVCYLAHDQKIGYSAIKTHLSAVNYMYINKGYGDVISSMKRLQITLRGIRKVHSKPQSKRVPLTADKIHALGKKLEFGINDPYTDALLWAAVCLGYFGALRCGEFTTTNFDSPYLQISDLSFHFDCKVAARYAILNLRGSKTDPFRLGCQLVLFETKQKLCPVTAMQQHLSSRQALAADSPLLACRENRPLSREKFISLLQHSLHISGVPVEGITGHSLRKGFATSASAASIEDNLISTMGRWRSDCYKLYINTPLSTVHRAQTELASPELCLKL